MLARVYVNMHIHTHMHMHTAMRTNTGTHSAVSCLLYLFLVLLVGGDLQIAIIGDLEIDIFLLDAWQVGTDVKVLVVLDHVRYDALHVYICMHACTQESINGWVRVCACVYARMK